MATTVTDNNVITSSKPVIATKEVTVIKKKAGSIEFLSGVFYIVKKVLMIS